MIYEGDLIQFSVCFIVLMLCMLVDFKFMCSWLIVLDEVIIECEDGIEVIVKLLMQIVNEYNENVEWYKNNIDVIDVVGDKVCEVVVSVVVVVESVNIVGEKVF